MTSMEESGPLPLVETCCGFPEVWKGNLCNLLRKSCLMDESLGFQAPVKLSYLWLNQSTLWHGELWEELLPQEIEHQQITSGAKKERWGSQLGFVRSKLSTGPVLEEWMRRSHRCRNHPICVEKHLPSMPWDLEWETYKESFVFTFMAKRSMWQLNSLQMMLNTKGRSDHLGRRNWSGQLSWSAKMFFFPRMYLTVKETKKNCSV